MRPDIARLIKQAKKVLRQNWRDQFTVPSPNLYPHQWNWDAGFMAIGYAHFHPRRAQQELNHLFAAQWRNGMLPQIVFNPEALGGYFPEPDFWQTERSANHPSGFLTSGITMPPLHALAAWKIYRHSPNPQQTREWLRDLFPRLLKMHRYFYRERDPQREGLVYIRHPWESGIDNAPAWDAPLRHIPVDSETLPAYQRKDVGQDVPASQRPTNRDYDRYVYLVALFRRLKYHEGNLYRECPFLIQDPLTNSLLNRSNEELIRLARLLGEDSGEIREWYQQTSRALRTKLWHADHGAFDCYDLRNRDFIHTQIASAFMPLICGAPTTEQANRIYQSLESNSFCSMHNDHCFSIPNYDLKGKELDTRNYWRGPVWINTNWLLMQGLKRYGFHQKARSVRRDIIELVSRWGFREYFDPYRGTGYGSQHFSWTAALFIATVMEK